jgi:hypothetical protein
MLLDALAVLSLVALAAFILWEGWQRRKGNAMPLDRAAMERGFVPGATAAEHMAFVGAVILAVFAGVLFASPPQPPFAGRGAVFSSLLYGALGPLGIPSATAGTAVACIALALSLRRRRLGRQRES